MGTAFSGRWLLTRSYSSSVGNRFQGVNIFVDKEKLGREMSSGAAAPDEDNAPEISLAEMMEDLEINDDPMGDDEEGEEEEDEA